MNNLRDIYNNIFTNIEDIYIYSNAKVMIQGYVPVIGIKANQIDKWNDFKSFTINNYLINQKMNFGLHVGNVYIDKQNITDIEHGSNPTLFNIQNINNKEYIEIPVYIVFTTIVKNNKNEDINYTILNNNNNPIDTSKLAFVINIVTHHVSSFTNKFEILAHEYFYRQFDYKQFSVNIFDHIYQPSFRLITSKEEISKIHDKYLIDFSSMGSIFINDPVNKYMFGLPKFNIDGLKKDFPDVYAIHQDQGINYRKVIANGSHNPFKK